jgi:hypothetical protein
MPTKNVTKAPRLEQKKMDENKWTRGGHEWTEGLVRSGASGARKTGTGSLVDQVINAASGSTVVMTEEQHALVQEMATLIIGRLRQEVDLGCFALAYNEGQSSAIERLDALITAHAAALGPIERAALHRTVSEELRRW